jgi:hypothetical protein
LRQAAEAGLERLSDLFKESSFLTPLDRTVAISGVLTTLVRGSLPTAPMYLIRAHAPGTGKSYIVDVTAVIATGRICPVITAASNEEEIEKRLGSVVLSGAALISIDNCTRDLGGEMLCQLAERALLRIRILGRSEMPECECRTTIFATGNNVIFKGDMVRRGLVCNLDALIERPELRQFQYNPLRKALEDRGLYVAAALTIIRAYLAAGAPQVCDAIGSYAEWSRMVRSPLIWLGQPDPVESMTSARAEARNSTTSESCSRCGTTNSTSTSATRPRASLRWPVNLWVAAITTASHSGSCCCGWRVRRTARRYRPNAWVGGCGESVVGSRQATGLAGGGKIKRRPAFG